MRDICLQFLFWPLVPVLWRDLKTCLVWEPLLQYVASKGPTFSKEERTPKVGAIRNHRPALCAACGPGGPSKLHSLGPSNFLSHVSTLSFFQPSQLVGAASYWPISLPGLN